MKFQISIILITLALTYSITNAQTLFPVQENHKHRLRLSTGLQPGFVQNLRYDYRSVLPLTNLKNSYFVSVEATLYRSWAENNSMRVGTDIVLWNKGPWATALELSLANGRLQNKVYQAEKWETTGKLTAGYFGKRAGVNAMLSYTRNLALQLTHTEFYTMTIFEDAVDGWYKGVGGFASIGVDAHFLLIQRLSLDLSVYSSFTDHVVPLTVSPVQISLGVGWRM